MKTEDFSFLGNSMIPSSRSNRRSCACAKGPRPERGAQEMEAAAEPQTVDGPSGWLSPQIPAGANILSESPIAYTLDNLLTGEAARLCRSS